jgi:hypothetical protein
MKANTDTTGLLWRKSTYSNGDGDCFEGASVEGGAFVRDTKARERGHLTIEVGSWSRLVAALKG